MTLSDPPTDTDLRELSRKYEQLESELRRFSEENATLKTACQALQSDNDSWDHDYNELDAYSGRLEAFAKKKDHDVNELTDERDQLRGDCHEAQRDRQTAEAAAETSLKQLAALKSSISASTKTSGQITDDEVRSRLDQIFYSIQDFAVTASRGAVLGRCDVCP